MKHAYIYYNYKNIEVISGYLKVIADALEQLGYKCKYVRSLDGIHKKELIVFSTGIDLFRYYLKGYRNTIVWQQGVEAEESFLRNHSWIRFAVINFMDVIAMKKAKMIFFVSAYMKTHYEKLAKTDFTAKSYIMPCFNEALNRDALAGKDYTKKVFAYVGSLAAWQCFRETVQLYKKIERRFSESFFKVLTFDVELAESIIQEHEILNYSVSCVPKEQVKAELQEVSFGFILRDDIEVNRVATPTKLSSYLAAGVLPIYSACLRDFHAQMEGKHCAFSMEPEDEPDELFRYLSRIPDQHIVREEIETLFETYYSENYHADRIAKQASTLLGVNHG